MVYSGPVQVGMTVAETPVTPDHDPSVRGGLDMATEEFTTPSWRRYHDRFPERIRAGQLVTRAIARGDLVRPRVCSACRSGDVVIQGHHDDYSKPLQVRWLCPACHHQADEARDAALIDRSSVELKPPIGVGVALIQCPGCGADMLAASCWAAWKCWACLRIITQGAAALP